MLRSTLLLLLCLVLASPVLADEKTYNRINLSAEASTDVENDTLVAVLYIEEQARTAAEAAETVNAAIGWGVSKAKSVDNVKVRTLDYSTSPVYTQRPVKSGNRDFTPRIAAWRVSQSMRVESTDADALSELITELQERLGIRSIGYQVSKPLREATEAVLIDEAILAFQLRAQQIAKAFGHDNYKLVQVSINTSGARPPMPYARGMAMEMAAKAPVAIEAGSSSLQVTINGSIELE
jgi:predicted secreted protein